MAPLLRLFASAAVVVAAACQSEVVLFTGAPEGGGGHGPAAGGGGAPPSSSGQAGTPSGGTAGSAGAAGSPDPTGGGAGAAPLAQRCADTCTRLTECNLPLCADGCDASPPTCQAEFLEVLDCIDENVNPLSCFFSSTCQASVEAYFACRNTCFTEFDWSSAELHNCNGSQTSCGGGTTYALHCTWPSDFSLQCDCFVDGASVGSCWDYGSCDSLADGGCCAALVIVQGL
jgi:hypothetical protein